MPVKTGGGLIKMSFILTEDQDQQIRAIHASRRKPANRVSLADVCREVVEEGLKVVLSAPPSNIMASDEFAPETNGSAA